MKTRVLWGAVPVLCALALAALALAQEHIMPLWAAMDDETYLACGLDKLTVEEQEKLAGLITGYPQRNMLDEAARHYMEEDGWRRVCVLGAVSVDDEYQIVLMDNYEIHYIRPFIVPKLPEPGMYWAKSVVTSYTLLYPDATEGSFVGAH